MKAFDVLILAIMIVSISFVFSPTSAYDNSSIGVKNGDWIEYTVNITGPTSAPAHNISWFRIDILDIESSAFQANVTVRNVNGTLSSSIWNFNFTEGQVEGWVIIPPNLGVGDVFYDSSKPANITILGEEQKIVAGATRTITHSSDSVRPIKEWDKATGVYTYSVEYPKNFTVISLAISTNMWDPQTMDLNQTTSNALVAISIVLAVFIVSSSVIARRNKTRKLMEIHPSQGKIAVLVILATVLGTIAAIVFFPFSTGRVEFR